MQKEHALEHRAHGLMVCVPLIAGAQLPGRAPAIDLLISTVGVSG